MEYWKPIKNFERYEVSNYGNVRSLDYTYVNKKGVIQHFKGQLLKQSITKVHGKKDGYCVVNLRLNGKTNVKLVHRLVAETFIDNPLNKPTVNHIDGNKRNNKVENLEWATYYENNVHAINNGLKPQSYKNRKITQCDTNGNIIRVFHSCIEASKATGINRSCISSCINGRTKKTKEGSYWYLTEG